LHCKFKNLGVISTPKQTANKSTRLTSKTEKKVEKIPTVSVLVPLAITYGWFKAVPRLLDIENSVLAWSSKPSGPFKGTLLAVRAVSGGSCK